MEERNFTFLSDAVTAIASSERKDPKLLFVEQCYTCERDVRFGIPIKEPTRVDIQTLPPRENDLVDGGRMDFVRASIKFLAMRLNNSSHK